MSTVDVAADYAARLLRSEARGPGDTESAMRRIEAKYGVNYWSLWSLRYKRPKSISADMFNRIRAAYLACCERQLASVSHELTMEKAKSGDDLYLDLETEVAALAEKIRAAKAA